MSYFIQSYGKGYIQRNGDKYELVVNGEVAGSYKSIDSLVKYNPTSSGKQVSTVDQAAETESVTEDAPAVETKKSNKATSKK